MEIAIFIGVSVLVLIVIVAAIIRKSNHAISKPPESPLELLNSGMVVEKSISQLSNRIVIGTNPELPLLTIETVAEEKDFAKAKPLNIIGHNGINRLNGLFQAVPSLLVAGEAHGKKLMEVVINGDLVRASDGNGLRAFTMNGKSISGQARLFEVENIQSMINAAAIWQIASVVVAQKHLADISKKLDEIKDRVKHISQFLENQRKSRILSNYNYLEQVHLAIKGGELPNSSRVTLESCEKDLIEIQGHLELEYGQKIDKRVEHKETFGTGNITNDIEEKMGEFERLTEDLALCMKTRIAAWHVLSLFPGELQLKYARKYKIMESIDSINHLRQHFEKSLENEIEAINSVWNKDSTLQERKASLNSKRIEIANHINSVVLQWSENLVQSERVLLEHDQPTRLYLQFENDELIEVRQAAINI